MPKSIKDERLRWVTPIINKEFKIVQILKLCPHSERSIKRWLFAYRKYGEDGLIPKSTKPKSHKYQTDTSIKEIVIAKRLNSNNICAFKIHHKLKKEGLIIPLSTISKILKDKGLVKKYRSVKQKYKYIKQKRNPGDLIEIDTKEIPSGIIGTKYYQYTAIDTSSRWRHLKIYDEQNTFNSINFLKELINIFPYKITSVKTDNGSIFTNYYVGTNKRSDLTVKRIHAFDIYCRNNDIKHYLIDPGKPTQNGKVERSHREDKKAYKTIIAEDIIEFTYKSRLWNNYYNDLEHCSLDGNTPNEVLLSYLKSAKCS